MASAWMHAASASGIASQIESAPPLQPGWQFGLLLAPPSGGQQ
jgi:hypothetical protein